MATTLRCQVTIPNVNGIPADAITNTWHVKGWTVDPVDAANSFFTDLSDFYLAIDAFLSSSLDTSVTVDFYDLLDAIPRVPVFTDTFTITPGANAPLPHEVACVLSYAGQAVSGTAAGRRRGRIFLGPLDSAVMDDSAGQSILQTSTITAIASAANDLMGAGNTSSRQWAVFSPTSAGSQPWDAADLLAGTLPVTHGFVDNAFDTMRSRGTLATTRVTWS